MVGEAITHMGTAIAVPSIQPVRGQEALCPAGRAGEGWGPGGDLGGTWGGPARSAPITAPLPTLQQT